MILRIVHILLISISVKIVKVDWFRIYMYTVCLLSSQYKIYVHFFILPKGDLRNIKVFLETNIFLERRFQVEKVCKVYFSPLIVQSTRRKGWKSTNLKSFRIVQFNAVRINVLYLFKMIHWKLWFREEGMREGLRIHQFFYHIIFLLFSLLKFGEKSNVGLTYICFLTFTSCAKNP